MKVAFTSNGNNLNANLDTHFARCACFVFYDTLTKGIEFLPNPYREGEEGVGEAVVKLISTRNVEKIITNELGLKAKSLLDSMKIQLIIYKNKEISIQDIINMLHQ